LISDLKESWAASRSAKMTETADQHTDPEVQQQSASFIEPDVRHSH
jgi:hypothetical protein